jgi:hypothetical protein
MARGSADRYFQAEVQDSLKLVPEGVEGRVGYKGPVGAVLHQMVGGLRAATCRRAKICDLGRRLAFEAFGIWMLTLRFSPTYTLDRKSRIDPDQTKKAALRIA